MEKPLILVFLAFLVALAKSKPQSENEILTKDTPIICHSCSWTQDNNTCTAAFRSKVDIIDEKWRCRVIEIGGIVRSQGMVPMGVCSSISNLLQLHQQNKLNLIGEGPLTAACCNTNYCNTDTCNACKEGKTGVEIELECQHQCKMVDPATGVELNSAGQAILNVGNEVGGPSTSKTAGLQAASFGGAALTQKNDAPKTKTSFHLLVRVASLIGLLTSS